MRLLTAATCCDPPPPRALSANTNCPTNQPTFVRSTTLNWPYVKAGACGGSGTGDAVRQCTLAAEWMASMPDAFKRV